MKKIIFSILILTALQSCSQKKETMIKQNPTITADNIVEEINKQVKHYDKEVMYKFRIESKYAFVEVLINDIPVYKNKPDEPKHHPNKKTTKL